MRHARLQKLQRFRRKKPFYSFLILWFAGLFLLVFLNMWSENSDEDIYITQSTFRQESNLDDVNDWFQDGSPTDGQVLNNNVEKEKATAKNRFANRFANPTSEVKIQAKIGDAVPKSTKYKEKWAVNLFENWRQQRNEKVSNTGGITDVNILHNTLEVMSDEELNRSLALFVCEYEKPMEANIRQTPFMV